MILLVVLFTIVAAAPPAGKVNKPTVPTTRVSTGAKITKTAVPVKVKVDHFYDDYEDEELSEEVKPDPNVCDTSLFKYNSVLKLHLHF